MPSTRPTVLLTGFEPFDGESSNPSWTTVQAVQAGWTGDAVVHARELPVSFALVGQALAAAISDTNPDIVICVGQAGGAAEIRVERIAINVDDARIPDNTGLQPIDEAIVAGAPAGHFSTLPIKASVAAISALGIPAVVSQTAGTYTCNHVFYLLMHQLAPGMRGGFVHVPYSAEQAAGTERPSLPIASMTAAIAAVVTATLANRDDARITGGALANEISR
ncbi:pyroglutamyl-peptidase I [Cryobacterium melibiosiphilum]|uniref:Pyrrolidone-carboxylate peptidase n=1 Tax=Cryobacterium melibiosiphilum TaxID=995039 RepID=A0A3A5MGC3_9MICO|nr:pyroglutamyl-peptidase I [Cryobacterium melibiosiphilum]RJT84586.1 pyroglutamyl-peptidase I [Cryobacterium melibiosiphilum]